MMCPCALAVSGWLLMEAPQATRHWQPVTPSPTRGAVGALRHMTDVLPLLCGVACLLVTPF